MAQCHRGSQDLPAPVHEPRTPTDRATQGNPEEGAPSGQSQLRRLVWSTIGHSASWPGGGERVGEATSIVIPWPHQTRAFERLYSTWPPKLLIADEVGLGKTIEAGLLLRQAWLSGRAKRILILAPKAVLTQWQIELREKFNMNWPIYDAVPCARTTVAPSTIRGSGRCLARTGTRNRS
jgi:hypothetical protein